MRTERILEHCWNMEARKASEGNNIFRRPHKDEVSSFFVTSFSEHSNRDWLLAKAFARYSAEALRCWRDSRTELGHRKDGRSIRFEWH